MFCAPVLHLRIAIMLLILALAILVVGDMYERSFHGAAQARARELWNVRASNFNVMSDLKNDQFLNVFRIVIKEEKMNSY